MFGKILIANRGEIAVRVIRTARRMGVRTVAVYSDADARSLHVAMADEAVHIGPSPVGESYLRIDKIIEAAKATGAEAIHPGYGFLSENPDFVEAVVAAGLVFIGPSASAIRAMGLKDAAKRLMERAGVPVVPGYHGEDQGLVLLAGKSREIGYPVLIKARAGGGGKGMRRVDHPDDFAEAMAAARREAKAAFGDDRVLVEKYVEKPRHIEVQVFGDNFGNAVHLFERDCSAQRRHQKVIEEAPAPGMTPELRQAMTEAAVKAAKAIKYSGAGTIEFIVDASEGLRPDRFWFMEMNTRLQVEHPVTEMVTGIDLVEWQLLVAAGARLPKAQAEIGLDGHAFEARIYAEDPSRGFLPATGTLHHLSFPETPRDGAAIRIETGVGQGDTISPYYDPMIAKLVVHAGDRASALAALCDALAQTRIAGSVTNIAFLAALARDPDFASGDVDTGLIGRKQEALVASAPPSHGAIARAALAATAPAPALSNDPWARLAGYAHFHTPARLVKLAHGEHAIAAHVSPRRDGRFDVTVDDRDPVTLETGRTGQASDDVVLWPGHITVFENGRAFTFAAPDPLDRADDAAGGDSLRAPMPGLVKLVRASAGETVAKGQALLVLEAMKMEHTITAPHEGVVAEIVTEGAQVTDGTVLVHFSES
ncbi:MAG TPA: acetyl/propionyl/methylcrotonyl-CoA carboxylase subunit alpha [Rhizobiaceae bacterium]|nr:acetyl/propionyl/methylcrotonyl-CoA carboxylase subunit alpha [Rhizobiaceae bacterium]